MPFTWSYSKLKNGEACLKKHYEVDLAKNYTEDTEQLTWGNTVHKALATACTGGALPAEMTPYQHWVDRVKSGPGKLLVEQKLAIQRDFAPCSYFAPAVWFRSVGDVIRVDGPVALGLDWKTGKVLHDSVQLMLLAQCIFSHYPEVQRVRTEFIWLKDDCTTHEIWDRPTIARAWVTLLPRVQVLEDAARTMNYPPKPGRLCRKYCPVTACPYHGKGYP